MKPVVVGRYYIDGYLALFITTTLVNITSIDCTEACIFVFNYLILLVKNIHLKDQNKHKYDQIEDDNMYNFDMYYGSYQTRIGASTNDMKYLLGMCLIIDSNVSIEVGENLEYRLRLNTNLPKIKYEQGPRIWQPKELIEQKKRKKEY